MKLLILDAADAQIIYNALFVQGHERLAEKIRVQFADPLLGGANCPRTIIIRDEGIRPLMMVNYDSHSDAEKVWRELCSMDVDGVVEETEILWP